MGSDPNPGTPEGDRRPLTLAMIRKLHAGLGIPAEVLIAAPANPDALKSGLQRSAITY